MASYLGVDWAGGCWVVVKTGDEIGVTTEPSILNVWHNHGRSDSVGSILVDIPIGLPSSGSRACDEEAKDRLESLGNTVFTIPMRDVVESDQYEKARERNNGSLGCQSWWLFPRIQEVDVFLQQFEDATEKFYESHPEVCFAEFRADRFSGKKTPEGRRERLEILEADADLHEAVTEIVREREDGTDWHDRISKSRLDDVIDAAILALTAKELNLSPRTGNNEHPALPEETEPEMDEVLCIYPEIIYPNIDDL